MHKVDTVKSNSRAFTMIELIFVIVIMGILSKFGIEFLAQAYNSFIFSKINNTLQANSASALETIGARLQFRIKDSVIVRNPGVSFQGIGDSTLGANATVLEWIGMDVDGFRGDSSPIWRGIIDLDNSNAGLLNTPDTNLTKITNLVAALSAGASSNGTASISNVGDIAIYFIGSDSDIQNGFGWDGAKVTNQDDTMHPVRMGVNNFFIPQDHLTATDNNFTGVDVYEYYQLAWTAYAVALEGTDLFLYYDYQPWDGEVYNNVNISSKTLLMENVDTFRFKSVGSVMKLQICVNSSVLEDYSLCKEKTIF